MRKTKSAVIKLAPYITTAIFILVILGAIMILLLPNLSDNNVIENDVPIESNEVSYAEIKLRTNGGVAYSWRYDIEDTKIVAVDRVESKALDDRDGGAVDVHYYFKGLAPGETKVVFEYYDAIDDSNRVIDTREFTISVDDNLNATATENK